MMKFILPMLILLTSSVSFAEGFKSSEEVQKEMQKYSAADMKKGGEHVADILVQITNVVEFAEKNKLSEKATKEVLRVSSLTLENDSLKTVGAVLMPLYKKDPKSFEKSLKSLSKKDADSLLKAIQQAVREHDAGNG